jgi:ferric-dicitrate binding protein FerR (iron transport regulator)
MEMNMQGQPRDLLDGDLGAEDRDRLLEAVARDPAAAREFDAELRLEALLVAAYRPEPDEERVVEAIRVRAMTRRLRTFRLWMAAAAGLAVLAAGALVLATRQPGVAKVEGGLVLVSGLPVSHVRSGETMSTGSGTGAVVRLAEGSCLAMAPDSVATVRGRSGEARQVVELRQGQCGFSVKAGPRRFAVITKVGRVTVLGTEFDVRLLPDWQRKGEDQVNAKVAMAMAVAVTVGSVQVEVGGKTYTLSAGAQQVFAEESGGGAVQPAQPRRSESERGGESTQPATPRKSEKERQGPAEKRFSGRVTEISGNTITVATGGEKAAKSTVITLDSATAVSVESDEMESVQGEGGQLKQRRRVVAGTLGDLAVGKRVTVTEVGGVITKVLVMAAPVRRSGGESKEAATAPQPRTGGEKERQGGESSRRSGGESEH